MDQDSFAVCWACRLLSCDRLVKLRRKGESDVHYIALAETIKPTALSRESQAQHAVRYQKISRRVELVLFAVSHGESRNAEWSAAGS